MFVSCETDDDLSYVIKYAGEDCLVIGTDYGHNDQSTEIDALARLKDNGGLTEEQYRKIVDANPHALWTL
jgi:microsomal dipeptidase-like Zn-dependent dipeptidase